MSELLLDPELWLEFIWTVFGCCCCCFCSMGIASYMIGKGPTTSHTLGPALRRIYPAPRAKHSITTIASESLCTHIHTQAHTHCAPVWLLFNTNLGRDHSQALRTGSTMLITQSFLDTQVPLRLTHPSPEAWVQAGLLKCCKHLTTKVWIRVFYNTSTIGYL